MEGFAFYLISAPFSEIQISAAMQFDRCQSEGERCNWMVNPCKATVGPYQWIIVNPVASANR
jgi:hypothetical protein